MRTTLDLDDSLVREAKACAYERGLTLTRFIEEGLRKVILETAARLDAPFPSSDETGAGGLQVPPGIDINDTSSVLEWLDELEAHDADS